jgi:signal transduction histidine kinase
MRGFTFWAVLLSVLVILLFNVQGWLVLSRTGRALEDELGARLEAVAMTYGTAAAGRWQQPEGQGLLASVLAANNLFNLFIVDESLRYVANVRDSTLVGRSDAALELDATEILSALSGVATRSRLYAAGPYYLKSAYAPLADSNGVVSAVLGVEADARFFAVLAQFRRTLVLINGLSLLAIAAVVFVSVSLARHALALEAAAGRAGTLALLGQLSAAVAHDIKNPLGIIRAAAERLKKRHAADSADPAWDYIPEEVDRLTGIVNRYLGLGSARAGEPEEIDPAALVHSVVSDLAHETRAHGIAVEAGLPALPPLKASRVELRQALLNLLLNAIQAQPEGGSVRITAETDRRWLTLRVADAGPGIAPADLRRVFEPFYTTREKGSGLGLFSVRRIVEAHRGRVLIDSRPGTGTTVTVKLPL